MNDRPAPPEERQLPVDAAMLDGLPDPVFLVNQDHVIADFNSAGRNLFGMGALGSRLEEFLDSDHVIHVIDDIFKGLPVAGSTVFLPYPIARNYEFNVWLLPDREARKRQPQGAAWAMVALHDVTASVKAAQMRADFVANVSHELRSPLSSLLGFIETLRGPARGDTEATERFLEIMESEAQRMTRLINELLTLSKLETEEHIRPENPVQLEPVLVHVADSLLVRATEREIKIQLDIPKNVPLVMGEADELTQVFQNLVSNAVSYGHENTPIRIALSASGLVPGTEDPAISVAIINQGDGIPAEEISRLTERFYRVDKGRSRSMGGTGLGLAIVKHIVARHRGHLEIESTPEGETSFTVSLPRADI